MEHQDEKGEIKCPWCKKYIDFYLCHGDLSEQEFEQEKERVNTGFWASIKEVQDEQYLLNKCFDIESALKMEMPIQIDMRKGTTFFGRFWFFSLADERNKILQKELTHFWIQSGACSMSFTTPICCELANATSALEQLEWEIQEFRDLKSLTKKILNHIEEEWYK